ncbi:enoyl-CoA hydratase/isomerase family protein [Stakelama tenebrarum]|uniref:Enoyl-CoA hydratase/isomerase family protein n=1 Tax=Stakelama tenebrarum TaxID=2711215 RepID=A0A6G6Y867_9SPHN|nr:enoyl-CoA hydratase/isomerase family protein [Sphingosinithalassobacter tenebrarum]QIG80766.1 enoyl-CoA hydratase/isomerase family protein [Sphingosinithalassobacter tenebrarum]
MAFEPERKVDYSIFEEIKLSLADRIMTVTLSNPGRRNALTPGMSVELSRLWQEIADDAEVSVVILTGEGDSFCSGADLSVLKDADDDEAEVTPVAITSRMARRHVMGILDCEKPVIAKVRGPAFGAGVNMALASDMVFAAPGAKFCDPHVKAGLVAGDGSVLLWPIAVGFHRAKEYVLTGDPIPAEEAERIGLINRVVPDEELDAHVQALAEKLRDLPPHAVNYTKMAMNVALKNMTQSGFEASLAYEVYSMQTQDHQEAMAAFAERRKGKFRGR